MIKDNTLKKIVDDKTKPFFSAKIIDNCYNNKTKFFLIIVLQRKTC